MIDTNVSLFRWPFRRLIGDDPPELVTRLLKKGVTQAWAASFEGLFCRDVAGVNERLASACRKEGRNFLVPFGCVNPNLPGWEEDLRRCHEIHHMAGIRLHPNYHGYTLGNPTFAKLVQMAASRGLLVQIALSMEDPRTQFPLMQVPPVDPAPLADLLPRLPRLHLLLLNAGYWGGSMTPHIRKIKEAGNAFFDIAMNERVGGLTQLIAETSPSRVVFGSHYPFFYFESAQLKVRSGGLPHDQERAITEGNAGRLLEGHS
jgi:uncharacterized protein